MDIKISETGEISQEFKPKNWQTEIIGKFLKKEIIEDKINKLSWAGQIKILNRVKKHYPEKEFWLFFADNLGFKLNNMAYFLTPDGKKKLFDAHNKWIFEKSLKPAEKELDSFGEIEYTNVVASKKIKSLIDFLK